MNPNLTSIDHADATTGAAATAHATTAENVAERTRWFLILPFLFLLIKRNNCSSHLFSMFVSGSLDKDGMRQLSDKEEEVHLLTFFECV